MNFSYYTDKDVADQFTTIGRLLEIQKEQLEEYTKYAKNGECSLGAVFQLKVWAINNTPVYPETDLNKRAMAKDYNKIPRGQHLQKQLDVFMGKRKKLPFSAIWTNNLKIAIKERSTDLPIECHLNSGDFKLFKKILKKPIKYTNFVGQHGRVGFKIDKDSIPQLVQALLNHGSDNSYFWASSICEQMDIELI